MTRKSHAEARAILDAACKKYDGKPASSATRAAQHNEAAGNEAWWTENGGSSPPYDSPRSRAYLWSYLQIAGLLPLYAKGLPLADGYLLLDRGVMKVLLLNHAVEFGAGAPPRFEVTPLGHALIATLEP